MYTRYAFIGISCLFLLSCGQEDRYNEECAMYGCDNDSRRERDNETSPTPTPQVIIIKGDKGDKGDPGQNGVDGINAQNCKVESVINGALITCPDSKAVVLNGVDGKNGVNSVTKLIAPCTAVSSPWKEQLICLNDGTLLGSFSDNASGLNTRFSIIPAGRYIDTDNSSCVFTVTVDANNNSKVIWTAGTNQYGTWTDNTAICSNNQ